MPSPQSSLSAVFTLFALQFSLSAVFTLLAVHSSLSIVFALLALQSSLSSVCTLRALQSSLCAVFTLLALQSFLSAVFPILTIQYSFSSLYTPHCTLHTLLPLKSTLSSPPITSATFSLTSFYTVCPSCLFALQWFASSAACGTLARCTLCIGCGSSSLSASSSRFTFVATKLGPAQLLNSLFSCSTADSCCPPECTPTLPCAAGRHFDPIHLAHLSKKKKKHLFCCSFFLFHFFSFSFSFSALLSLTVFWGRFWQTRHALVSSISFAAHKSLPTDWLTDCPTEGLKDSLEEWKRQSLRLTVPHSRC